ncbi:glutamine-hydrolyzing GMP synthase [Blattabacterium cuenoti]|uniref:glutamine-hydrolyzing GMP synthase n=1 Tax=Blattabacterium cuenoti TaxID=1653831 RepID=UPI00163C4BB5|nr:glutamine-hydrolyzing GMP synthase [Blattabacterium cuenoti]
MKIKESIIILDFGSQYSHIISRRIRDIGIYTILCEHNISVSNIIYKQPKGIILSGGPFSVYNKNYPSIYKNILELNIPILGICYGMQLISYLFGGIIKSSKNKEYGKSYLSIIDRKNPLFLGIPKNKSIVVWMSHSDEIKKIPKELKIIGKTKSCPIAAFYHKEKNIYAVQFHPEVSHTEFGIIMIKNFVIKICKCKTNNYNLLNNIIKKSIHNIIKVVSKKKVILGISGGLDSFVTALLIYKAIKNSLYCIFINHGLLLEEEEKFIKKICKSVEFPIRIINAKDKFLSKLVGVTNPEQKRKIIGEEFIKIFQKESKNINDVKFLAQGTIYSDVIESSKSSKLSDSIKSHHNVGGLPKNMNLKLLEPLKKFFKDEVKEIGRILGVPNYLLNKHPFPGPGIGIRIIGEINEKKISILRKAENILFQELNNYKLYKIVDQAFIILLPIKSVGIMGDKRSYEYTAILRSINTKDFMTATFSYLSYEFLEQVSNRIINEVNGINRMLYDISSKPPSTIEWE